MRGYQKECIDVIKETFKTRKRQLIQLPTGAGKTWIFCQYLNENSDRSLMICPSIELKEQILKSCTKFKIDASEDVRDGKKNHVITSASLSYKSNKDVIYKNKYDHIVIDEAHHSQCKTYKNFLSGLENNTKILGCTATPERLDRKSLLDIFGILSYEKSIYDLIEQGFLSDIIAYKIKTHQKIPKRGSFDFRAIDLKMLDNDSRNTLILDTFMKNCKNMKTLIFCINVNHAEKINLSLQNLGIKSACVHGGMSKVKRMEILSKFKKGKIQVITNCQLLTEGFDEPSIEALIIARPTSSKSLYCQMIGRGLRKTDTKDVCYLYEITDNNFKICTFNVACDEPPENQKDYRQGIRLSELKKEIEKIPLIECSIIQEPMELFANSKKLPGNPINILSSPFYSYDMTSWQKWWLDFHEIKHRPDTRFLEAAFLIWKRELEDKHAENRK